MIQTPRISQHDPVWADRLERGRIVGEVWDVSNDTDERSRIEEGVTAFDFTQAGREGVYFSATDIERGWYTWR